MTTEISARESEVLALVGEHLSNAEIATRLYISVRTVESHVSSLLRKLEMPDRRALARRAPAPRSADGDRPPGTDRSAGTDRLPAPLTSFVGRDAERAALVALLGTHRQVTAVGPGGVGKTRLALAAAGAAADRFDDGVWFVDLVSTTDPGMVAATVAAALGLGEQPGRAVDDVVLGALADHRSLLVLDNCEHVRDGVAPFTERLLAACPGLTILATSRARLMVPYERVYDVPPLSLAGGAESEAVALFAERAAAVGVRPGPGLREHAAAVCGRLDGMALAIELAAARSATLGIDGLTAGLADPLRMLAGGSRADHRHRSVRAVLDWSHALLDPPDRDLLHLVSVFAEPFTVEAAAAVAGANPGTVADGLARLAEQSLLTVTEAAHGTEYRALETIRQYGAECLAAAGRLDEARSRHLGWCLTAADGLRTDTGERRSRFDAVADDLRAALAWAADRTGHRDDARLLASRLADLAFARGLIDESQQRYEQAAALTDDPRDAAAALRSAAAVAICRMRGDDMYRLHNEAAAVARAAGDLPGAARDLATAATHAHRFSGEFVRLPTRDRTVALVDEARALAGDDPAALAAVALAEAGVLEDAFGAAQGPARNDVRNTLARAEEAVALAVRTGDPLAHSAALDALTGAQSWNGDAFGVAATIRRRVDLVSAAPEGPARTLELMDALTQAVEAALGVGDLAGAEEWTRRLAGHPLLSEVGYRATGWGLVAAALGRGVEEAPAMGERFLEGWRRAGRPAGTFLGPAVSAAMAIHDLRGDEEARRSWADVLARVGTLPGHGFGYRAVFDGLALLHHGHPGRALDRMAPEPADVWKWVTWIWHHWYVALRTEAAVLAGAPDAAERVAAARPVVAGNPVADALVERAAALLDGDTARLLATVAVFDAAGCRYQSARTLVLAGGGHAARGAAAVAELGLGPMSVRV